MNYEPSYHVPRVGLEDRDPETPPVDALAESIVLVGALHQPERLDECDLMPLLVFSHHKQILEAMRAARLATAGKPWAQFYLRWLNECERRQHGLADVIDERLVDQSWQRWMRTRHDRANLRPSDPSGHITNYAWWLKRLQQVADSRAIIDASQRILERAWRGDVEGATEIAAAIRQRGRVIRVEV